MRVAAKIAKPADAMAPKTIASRPSRAALAPAPVSCKWDPTFSTSAAATPSGYGRSELVTKARLSGIVNSTPKVPPEAQTRKDSQKGNPDHQPTITRPGNTKIIDAIAPAADATVWTMLFSRIFEPGKTLSTAMDMTAAGMDEAMVRPTFSPRYTL